jgi:hypothetical protein
LPPSGDRSKAVMVMVIAELLLGDHHRLRGRQAVKANSPRLKTIWLIPARLRRSRMRAPT